MVDFVFTPEQRERAVEEGLRRQTANQAKSLRGRNNAPVAGQEAELMHLIGAAGEMAVAVYLGMEDSLYKDKIPVRGSCDLPGIDVKCRSEHWHDLLIQLDDDPKKIFVLVTIANKRTIIHGWVKGEEVMKEELKRSFRKDRPCYAIPKHSLKPMEELKCHFS